MGTGPGGGGFAGPGAGSSESRRGAQAVGPCGNATDEALPRFPLLALGIWGTRLNSLSSPASWWSGEETAGQTGRGGGWAGGWGRRWPQDEDKGERVGVSGLRALKKKDTGGRAWGAGEAACPLPRPQKGRSPRGLGSQRGPEGRHLVRGGSSLAPAPTAPRLPAQMAPAPHERWRQPGWSGVEEGQARARPIVQKRRN